MDEEQFRSTVRQPDLPRRVRRPRRSTVRIGFFKAMAGALLLAGCVHFKESYIVKVATGRYGNQIEPPQFYKFQLEGCAWFQRTEFQCGWYDKDAVDQLFSEVVSETSARNVESGGAQQPTVAKKPLSATPAQRGEGPYMVLGPGGESFDATNRRFVMIAANNPKRIVQQISQLANNKQLAGSIASIVQASERLDHRKAKARRDQAVDRHAGTLDVIADTDAALEAAMTKAGATLPSAAAIDELLRRVRDVIPQAKGK